jgi:hypothetical protein
MLELRISAPWQFGGLTPDREIGQYKTARV